MECFELDMTPDEKTKANASIRTDVFIDAAINNRSQEESLNTPQSANIDRKHNDLDNNKQLDDIDHDKGANVSRRNVNIIDTAINS